MFIGVFILILVVLLGFLYFNLFNSEQFFVALTLNCVMRFQATCSHGVRPVSTGSLLSFHPRPLHGVSAPRGAQALPRHAALHLHQQGLYEAQN